MAKWNSHLFEPNARSVAEGDTTPTGTTNALLWSSTLGCWMRWTGTAWTSKGVGDTKISAATAMAAGDVSAGLDFAADYVPVVDTSGSIVKKILPNDLNRLRTCLGTSVTNSSNTTPTDCTGLAFTVKNGHTYWFQFIVTYKSAATTTGVAFMFSAPTMTSANFTSKVQQAANGTDQFFEQSSTTLTTQAPSASVVALSTDYIAIIEGNCTPSADGTLQLRVRSEINASTVTVENNGTGVLALVA